jgi:hypothetical protein
MAATIKRRMNPAISDLNDLSIRIRQQEDRAMIVDALHRFAAGQDLKDWSLFTSAFTENAELDFVQPAKRLGQTIDVFRGRDLIVQTVSGTLSRLHTTHTVSNPRVELNGDEARMFALVEAQHLRADDHSRHLLLKNFYWLHLRQTKDAWRIANMRIENVWLTGDPAVLFGAE